MKINILKVYSCKQIYSSCKFNKKENIGEKDIHIYWMCKTIWVYGTTAKCFSNYKLRVLGDLYQYWNKLNTWWSKKKDTNFKITITLKLIKINGFPKTQFCSCISAASMLKFIEVLWKMRWIYDTNHGLVGEHSGIYKC